ncbi:MAG: hypothetical protein HKM01_06690 [Gallionella sp.]|nr:hypothetical protein [Gallionella sp.]
MKKRLADLAQRRRVLVEKIATQRGDVAAISRHLKKPLAMADAGLKAMRYVHAHPAWLAGGVAVLMTFRRRGIVGLVHTGSRLLRLYAIPIVFSLKSLYSGARAPSTEKLLLGQPQEHNAKVDH